MTDTIDLFFRVKLFQDIKCPSELNFTGSQQVPTPESFRVERARARERSLVTTYLSLPRGRSKFFQVHSWRSKVFCLILQAVATVVSRCTRTELRFLVQYSTVSLAQPHRTLKPDLLYVAHETPWETLRHPLLVKLGNWKKDVSSNFSCIWLSIRMKTSTRLANPLQRRAQRQIPYLQEGAETAGFTNGDMSSSLRRVTLGCVYHMTKHDIVCNSRHPDLRTHIASLFGRRCSCLTTSLVRSNLRGEGWKLSIQKSNVK